MRLFDDKIHVPVQRSKVKEEKVWEKEEIKKI